MRVGLWKVAIARQNEGIGKFGTPVEASLVKPRLYNLDTDIGERTDVAADHPDVLTRLVSVAQNGR